MPKTAIIMGKAPSCNHIVKKEDGKYLLVESNEIVEDAIVVSLNEASRLTDHVDYGFFIDYENIINVVEDQNIKCFVLPTYIHIGQSKSRNAPKLSRGYIPHDHSLSKEVFSKIGCRDSYFFQIHTAKRKKERFPKLEGVSRISHAAAIYCIDVFKIKDFVFTGISKNQKYHKSFKESVEGSVSNEHAYNKLVEIMRKNKCSYRFVN
jgi:hypothetical protein